LNARQEQALGRGQTEAARGGEEGAPKIFTNASRPVLMFGLCWM
jgi:hypothetical protein